MTLADSNLARSIWLRSKRALDINVPSQIFRLVGWYTMFHTDDTLVQGEIHL